jgi:preprotein translocase subunit SecE
MKAINYFLEVRAELAKVVWPSREQTIRYTVLVIVVAIAVGLILGGLDYLLTLATNFLIGHVVK